MSALKDAGEATPRSKEGRNDSDEDEEQARLDKDAVDSLAPNGQQADPAKELKAYPAMYGPCNVRNLEPGTKKLWCTCGLSKKQPWCDGSHSGTDFKPLRWTVPGTLADGRAQAMYQICACKYTKSPPYCDATHTNLPLKVLQARRECPDRDANHRKSGTDGAAVKLCSSCGWVPDW